MQIFDAITDEPLKETLQLAHATEVAWQPQVKHLIDLFSFLNSVAPQTRVYGCLLSENPPWLLVTGPNKCSLKIASDYYDGSQRAGPLALHFRLHIQRSKDDLTHDIRTNDFYEVAREIRQAFDLRDS